jgi:MurNAc alpha-1-phosphate uridylyltransferase
MAVHPTRAMVMAAGLGKRMLPLTEDIPKPMVKVAGRPLIDHVLGRLTAAAVTDVVVNLHYRGEVLQKYLERRNTPNILFSDETDLLLDTGGGIKKALPLLGGGPFFTHNSDSLWIEGVSNNLRRMGDMWDDAKMDALMLLAPLATSTGFEGRGDFTMDRLGRLRRRRERTVAPFVWTGVQIIRPEVFENTPDGPFSTNLIWDRAIENDRLYGIRLDGRWMHVGSPSGIEEAEAVLCRL